MCTDHPIRQRLSWDNKKVSRQQYTAPAHKSHTMAPGISRTGSRRSRGAGREIKPKDVENDSEMEVESDSEDDEPKAMDADEEALSRMVLGDDDDFMAQLHNGTGAMDAESDEDVDRMDVEGEEDNDNLEAVDDAEVGRHGSCNDLGKWLTFCCSSFSWMQDHQRPTQTHS